MDMWRGRVIRDIAIQLYGNISKELNPLQYNVYSQLILASLEHLLNKAKAQGVREIERKLNEKKQEILEAVFKAYECNRVGELLRRANDYLENAKKALKSLGYDIIEFIARTREKLLIGLSGLSPGRLIFEVGLSWDPLLNLPYIPGSSIKGAFRAYLELTNKSIAGLTSGEIFGTQDKAGILVFLDSYPIECRDYLLIPEVTTPIYSEIEDRIKETKARPVPVVYLAINKDVKFRFIIGVSKSRVASTNVDLNALRQELLRFAVNVMREGIGAKTLLGYGILEV